MVLGLWEEQECVRSSWMTDGSQVADPLSNGQSVNYMPSWHVYKAELYSTVTAAPAVLRQSTGSARACRGADLALSRLSAPYYMLMTAIWEMQGYKELI